MVKGPSHPRYGLGSSVTTKHQRWEQSTLNVGIRCGTSERLSNKGRINFQLHSGASLSRPKQLRTGLLGLPRYSFHTDTLVPPALHRMSIQARLTGACAGHEQGSIEESSTRCRCTHFGTSSDCTVSSMDRVLYMHSRAR